jgi:succinoglycan biosynthesis transport protein ExoP
MKVGSPMSEHVGEISPLRTFGLLSLRRRWKLLFMCGALTLIIGVLVAVFKPVTYTASTQLLVYVRELQPGPEPVISLGRADLTQLQNEIEIIRSPGMLAKVVRSLKLADDIEFVPVATPLRMATEWLFRTSKVTFDESRTKQDLAVEAVEKHVTVKRIGTSHTILVSVITSDAQKSERIANAIGQIALQARVSAEQEGSRSPLLRERLQGLGPNAYVMTAAGAPARPDGPPKVSLVLGAAILGIAVGSALALFLDFTNQTMRTAAQVEYLGLECIGAIPRLRRRAPTSGNQFVSGRRPTEEGEFHPNSMLDQTLRRATVAIEASNARIIGVTSAVAREGAATVAKHLARVAACTPRKVLLVEARRNEPSRSSIGEGCPELASVSDKSPRPRNRVVLDEHIGLDVLEADSLDGIGGAAAWWMHCDQNCLSAYELIVVSLPPLELGPEFRMAAQKLDGILLVLKWGDTELEEVERAIVVSGVAPSEFIGAVFNMMDERMIGTFGDKLWKAEAMLLARRRPFDFSMPAERAIG